MLYKYLSINSKSYDSILNDYQVFFSQPKMLNDPFELRPLYTVPSKTKIKKYLSSIGKNNKQTRGDIPEYLEAFIENLEILNNSMADMNSSTGIFCLTPHYDNILMWSHYADSHKGICVGFDVNQGRDPEFKDGYPVEYKLEYPKICLLEQDLILSLTIQSTIESFFTTSDPNLKFLSLLLRNKFFTKAKVWKYEDEVRFCDLSAKKTVGLVSYSPKKLSEIILGSQIETHHKVQVIKMAKRNFPNARIMEANISNSSYELEITDL